MGTFPVKFQMADYNKQQNWNMKTLNSEIKGRWTDNKNKLASYNYV